MNRAPDLRWTLLEPVVLQLGLVDAVRRLQPDNTLYTWSRGRLFSRIDHIFFTPDFMEAAARPRVDYTPRSDHRALSLDIDWKQQVERGRRPWRLNVTHLQHPDFEQKCQAIIHETCSFTPTMTAKQEAKGWAACKKRIRLFATRYGMAQAKKSNLLMDANIRKLRKLERKLQHNIPPERQEDWLREIVETQAVVSTRTTRVLEGRRVRSRARWCEEGERSTRYFYRCIKARDAATYASELFTADRQPASTPEAITARLGEFYSALFARGETSQEAQDTLLAEWTARLTQQQQAILDAPFTAAEMEAAIDNSPFDKTPGPDGLSFEFYKHWPAEMARTLAEIANKCWEAGTVPASWRKTTVVLIPKKGELRDLGNWRPISLSNTDAKIITQVLTARLQRVAGALIDPQQTGFVKGRDIFDNIHTIHLAIECGMLDPQAYAGTLLMLDQRKAYDRVDWEYLDRCMAHCGIGERYRQLVFLIYNGSTADVRFSAWTAKDLPICQGLRQGDPLSPLLYNLVAEPLLCYFRNRLAGISLPGYAFRAIAFADDIAVALSSAEDVAIFNTAIDLHSRASNAKLNDDKTEMLRIGRPSFTLPAAPLPAGAVLRYLGIFFTEKGIATEHTEGLLLAKIKAQIHRWRDRQLSLKGRVLLANSVLLAQLWYAARIVPFSAVFYKQVNACVREFIWKSRRSKTKWSLATLPKKQGGLGLLSLENHSLAIFAKFAAQMLRQKSSPWWAVTAQWVLDQQLGKKHRHSSDLLAIPQPKRWPKGIPAFWERLLRCWKGTQGKGPDADFEGPLEALLGLPFDHPAVARRVQMSDSKRKRLRANKIFTLGDVFERHAPTGAAISRDEPVRLQTFVQQYRSYNIIFHQKVVQRLVDYPSEPNTRAVWAHVQLGGVSPEAYRPRRGRLAATPSEIAPLRLDRWERGGERVERSEEALTKLSKARWKRLPKIPLEPKHLSLLWLMAHAAVPTAAQLYHLIPELTPNCKACRADFETISHYFWGCPRVQDFWQRVSRFLQDIRADTARPAFSVNLVMAVTGFGAWRSKLPNADALHGLAVWEIYRARTELSLDSVMHSGEAMFLRWQSTAMLRIVHDYTYSFSRLKAGQPFHKRWLQVSNRWYHFDPGEDEDSGKLTFRDSNYPLDSRLHYFLHPSTATDADTSSALSTTTISDPPPNARDPVG